MSILLKFSFSLRIKEDVVTSPYSLLHNSADVEKIDGIPRHNT